MIGNFEAECDQVEHEFSKPQLERYDMSLTSHFKSDLVTHWGVHAFEGLDLGFGEKKLLTQDG